MFEYLDIKFVCKRIPILTKILPKSEIHEINCNERDRKYNVQGQIATANT